MDAKFYGALRRQAGDLLAGAVHRAAQYVRERQSPLCAFCIEYDDQGSFNVRMETESDWYKRDREAKTYCIQSGSKWLDMSHDTVVASIRKGRFSPSTKCRRAGNYREFEIARCFPAEFGA